MLQFFTVGTVSTQSVVPNSETSNPDLNAVNYASVLLMSVFLAWVIFGNHNQNVSKIKVAKKHVNRELQARLLRRVHHNTAERLLNHARASNPGRSEKWYWEKVIYELDRDLR